MTSSDTKIAGFPSSLDETAQVAMTFGQIHYFSLQSRQLHFFSSLSTKLRQITSSKGQNQ